MACSQLLKNWNSWRTINRKVVLAKYWSIDVGELRYSSIYAFHDNSHTLNFTWLYFIIQRQAYDDYMTCNKVYLFESSILTIILLRYKDAWKPVWYDCHYSIYAGVFQIYKVEETWDYQSWVRSSSRYFSLNAEFPYDFGFLARGRSSLSLGRLMAVKYSHPHPHLN